MSLRGSSLTLSPCSLAPPSTRSQLSPLSRTASRRLTSSRGSPGSTSSVSRPLFASRRRTLPLCRAHKVEVEHNGTVTVLEVAEDETILNVALDKGMELPHDCKLGVCMTCPAKIVSGSLDQSEGMLSDDVQEAGYALMCAAYPRSDCKIRVIPEEELLSLQLVA